MSIGLQIESEIGKLNNQLRIYAEQSGKSAEQILRKQGPKLAFALGQKLAANAPGKGTIKSAMLARLKGRSGGVYVRPSVRLATSQKYGLRQETGSRRFVIGNRKRGASGTVASGGKRLNLQALAVRAELGLREKGSGYLGYAARVSKRSLENLSANKFEKFFGRYGQQVQEAGLQFSTEGGMLTLIFPGAKNSDGNSVADGMLKPNNQSAIASAISEVTADIARYVPSEMSNAAARAGL